DVGVTGVDAGVEDTDLDRLLARLDVTGQVGPDHPQTPQLAVQWGHPARRSRRLRLPAGALLLLDHLARHLAARDLAYRPVARGTGHSRRRRHLGHEPGGGRANGPSHTARLPHWLFLHCI